MQVRVGPLNAARGELDCTCAAEKLFVLVGFAELVCRLTIAAALELCVTQLHLVGFASKRAGHFITYRPG